MRRFALALLFLIIGILSIYSYQKYIHKPAKPVTKTSSPRNLYIITASGLRAEHLSSYLYQPIQTPAIDFLAYDGVRFTNAYTSSTESLSAHVSILTGMYPFRRPIQQTMDYLLETGQNGLPKELTTLPGFLTKKGYRTTAFLSDPELRFPSFFKEYFHSAFAGDHVLYPWQNAYATSTVCRLARNWIKQNAATPHFVLLNFSEPTFPFEPPAPYNKQYTRYPYDGEVAGLDEQIGLFVALLKETGLFQRSVIILTSPYGETLSDSSRYTSPSNSLVHVPLMVTAPGLLPRKENYDAQVSLVDLMPTILELLGYPNEEKMDGTTLFQKGKRAEISREFVLGTVPFGKLLGFAPAHFIRNDTQLYFSGTRESTNPHRFVDKTTEQERVKWIRESRAILNKEGIRIGVELPEGVETEPALLLEEVHRQARTQRPAVALDLLQVFSGQMQSAYLETLKGMLSSACQDQDAAVASLRRAVELGPTSQRLALYARTALAAGRPEEAMNALKRFTAISRKMSYDVRSTYAIILQKMNQEDEALVQFGNVLKENPRYAEAHLYRGKIWKKLGRPDQAEQDLKMAIEVQWDYIPAYKELAELFEEHGKPADAVPYLRQLLRFEPENYGVMLQLAEIHHKAGKPLEARKLLQDVILNSKNQELKTRAKKQLAAL